MTDSARQIAALHAGRIEAARAARGAGRRVVGYIGLDVPEELILAAGLVPLRLEADVLAPAPAAARFGGGGHPVLRSLVSRLLGGPYDFIDHLVVGSMPRNLTAIAVLIHELHASDPAFARLQVHQLDVLHSDTDSARRFTLQQVESLAARLADWSGRAIGTAELQAAIALCNETRRLLGEYQRLRADGAHLDGVSALRLHGCATGAGREHFNAQLRDWLRADALRGASDAIAVPRVLYSGTATDTTDFYAAIESQGLCIVDDDQDFGARAVGPLVDERAPPLPALAAALAGRAPASAGWCHAARSAYLRQRLAAGRPDGVLFYGAAYDHPPAWEYPALRALAESMGCACALLDERSYTRFDSVAPAARAFADTLRARQRGHAA